MLPVLKREGNLKTTQLIFLENKAHKGGRESNVFSFPMNGCFDVQTILPLSE